MRKHVRGGAVLAAVGCFVAVSVPAQAADWKIQHVEVLQQMTAGMGTAVGQAFNISMVHPIEVGFSSPYGGVLFQNTNILDASFAHALAATAGGVSISNAYAGNNVVNITN